MFKSRSTHSVVLQFLGIAIFLSLCCQSSAQIYTALVRGASTLDSLGESVSRLGDVNGDGVPDLVVGAPTAGLLSSSTGRVLVLSGFDAAVIHQIDSVIANQRFGQTVAGLGDVDGDGTPDFLGGSFQMDSTGATTSGHVTLYSGLTGLALYSIDGNHALDRFGSGACSLGDLDSDGLDDFAVAAKWDNSAGSSAGLVRVFSGASGSVLYTFTGNDAGDQFGSDIASAGDVDNDGSNDLMVGAARDEGVGGSISGGSIHIYSGATGLLIRSHIGTQATAELGTSVCPAGDINLDGFADYAASSPYFDSTTLANVGAVTIFSGANGAVLRNDIGLVQNARLGVAINNVGDFNGDGVQDLATTKTFNIGTSSTLGGTIVEVRSGANGAILATLVDHTPIHASFGLAVDSLGDLNQDGLDDFVVGAPRISASPQFSGRVQAYMAPGPVVRRVQSAGVQPRFALTWTPAAGNPQALTGTIHCQGATPGGSGLVVCSLDGSDQVLYGYIPVQVNIDPYFVVVNSNFGFDALGSTSFPNVNRQLPNLAGLHFHVQVFELSPIVSASNSLVFEFAP